MQLYNLNLQLLTFNNAMILSSLLIDDPKMHILINKCTDWLLQDTDDQSGLRIAVLSQTE